MIELKDIMIRCPECKSLCKTTVDETAHKLFFACYRCGNSEEMPIPILSRKYQQ